MAAREKTETVDLKVRMKEGLRAQVEAAAQDHGVSLNAEAVARLEQSFRDQRLMVDAMQLVYGPQLADLVLKIGDVMKAVVEFKPFNLKVGDQDAFDDPWRYDQMVQAARYVLDYFRPNGDIVPPRQVLFMVPSSVTDPEQHPAAIEREFAKPAKAELNVGENLAKHHVPGIEVMSGGGNLARRGKNSWRLKFEAGDRDPVTGKRLTRFVTVRGTKKTAQAELIRLLAEVDTGTSVDPSRVTVAEYLRGWLDSATHLAPKTMERYR